MSGCQRPSRSTSGQHPIAYQGRGGGGARASSDLSRFAHKNHGSEGKNRSSIKSESKSPEILSTAEVISAVGHVWGLLSSFNIPESNDKFNYNCTGCKRNIVLRDFGWQKVCEGTRIDTDGKYLHLDVRSIDQVVSVVKLELESVNVTQKMAVIETLGGNDNFLKGGSNFLDRSWWGKGSGTVGISHEPEKIYGWMRRNISSRKQYPYNIVETENTKNDKSCSPSSATNNAVSVSINPTHQTTDLDLTDAHCHNDPVKLKEALLADNIEASTNIETTNCLSSAYFPSELQDINTDGKISKAQNSCLSADYCVDFSTPAKSINENVKHYKDSNEVTENMRQEPQWSVISDKMEIEIHSTEHGTPQCASVKQEHAFAGAFAGVFVSLCLHPVDTVKTVIQSCCTDQKSVINIGRSIVSERGVTGLYRGIASKIASSAPISAIYTFTYESVKGTMFPLFPKEYQAVAHCVAGGCASIATSFIFTPSERIKQQMQIGSHYNNCWSALVGIIGKGGFRSLYAGWGAVLYRNVPHSVIKFYTYESIKQLMTSSQDSGSQLNTMHTLVCGGLAGSTAALFTTPFDVVKTRLQTQIPGSKSQYESVFHVLGKIGKNEGLRGLYRGLIPRLVMYTSQGALFFASYESFKTLLSMKIPLHNALRIQHKEDMHDR